MKCCFCKKEIEVSKSHDIRPIVVNNGDSNPRCCLDCNMKIVLPSRISLWDKEEKYTRAAILLGWKIAPHFLTVLSEKDLEKVFGLTGAEVMIKNKEKFSDEEFKIIAECIGKQAIQSANEGKTESF